MNTCRHQLHLTKKSVQIQPQFKSQANDDNLLLTLAEVRIDQTLSQMNVFSENIKLLTV